MDFTSDKINNDKNIFLSLLKFFTMFKIDCWGNNKCKDDQKQTLEKVAREFSNCGKETMIDLYLLETNYQEIITNFVSNTMLHHVGMIWIIENHEYLKYDMDLQNYDWMKGGPWYNQSICIKLHGKVFEGFIVNARTDRYNIMCFIDAYERENQQSSCDDDSNGGGCPLPKKPTTTALESLGATIDFIGCWLKALEHNFI